MSMHTDINSMKEEQTQDLLLLTNGKWGIFTKDLKYYSTAQQTLDIASHFFRHVYKFESINHLFVTCNLIICMYFPETNLICGSII